MSRSLSKGPFVAMHLLKKINRLNETNQKVVVDTWSRSSTVIPDMIGHTIGVYNGRRHVPTFISDQMIGHKLGEFVPTRNFRSHVKSDRKARR